MSTAIAVFGVCGKMERARNKDNRLGLSKFGWLLLVLVLGLGTVGVATLASEKNKVDRQRLVVISMQRMIYARILGEVETIKRAFLWMPYDLFAESRGLFEYEANASKFLHPNQRALERIEQYVLKPLKHSLHDLEFQYETNAGHVEVKVANALAYFLDTMEQKKFTDVLANYSVSEATEFSDYLFGNKLGHHAIQYVFLTLHSLEEKTLSAQSANSREFYSINTDCRNPTNWEKQISCL